jgi:hypothetical protein
MPGMHADVVSAAAGVAQAAILIGAALIAYRQVREARRLREDQAKPYVMATDGYTSAEVTSTSCSLPRLETTGISCP